jgi:hypothetical protein
VFRHPPWKSSIEAKEDFGKQTKSKEGISAVFLLSLALMTTTATGDLGDTNIYRCIE